MKKKETLRFKYLAPLIAIAGLLIGLASPMPNAMAAPKHSVTYVGGAGATGTAPTQADVAEGATFTVASNTFAKAGYQFVNWSNGTTTYAPGATYTMGTSNVTLTAHWTPNPTHTVTYAAGSGATGTPPTQAPVSEGASFTTAANTFSKVGFHFVNWSDGSTTYAAGASYTMGTSNVTLTAQWAANPTHTVTYAGGSGATGTPPTQTPVSEGASFTTAVNTFSKAGFHFVNWSDGSTTYAESVSYTMGTSNVTLTAQWAANTTHTVTYAGGAGATGTPPTQAPVSEGASFTTAANTFSNPGYHFVNWSDGSTTYAAGASYTMGTSDVTLTAQWAANPTHTVTYAGGAGATGTPPTQADVAEGVSFTTAANTFTKAGFHFVNWSDGSTTYAESVSYTMATSDVTLTAQWAANPTHTVTYAGGAGATGTPPTQGDVSEGASFTTATNTFSNPGYHFVNWSDGSTTYAESVSYTMSTSNVTLTAQWAANPTHTVTYAGGAGATGTAPTQAPVSEGASFTTAANTFSKVGFHFVNWSDGSTTYAAGASYTMDISNVTLTAQWAANPTHTVTYTGGAGATGTPPTQADVAEGVSFTTAANTFTKAGFHFVNWSDGSTTYAESVSYTMGTSNVTLTAQWAANPTHTVTYAGGAGATGTAPTQADVSEGASFTTAANTFSKPGYHFVNWSDGSTTYAESVSYTMGTSNVTLTAQWAANPTHTVTYAGGAGATGTPPTQADVAEGVSFTTAANTFTKAGFHFVNWSDGSTTYAAGASYTMATSNVTLTAQWAANPTHTVTYAGGAGATGTPPTQAPVSEGASFTTAANTFSKVGYHFVNWSDGSTTYAAGASYTMATSNVTLTAQWAANPTHTVTYAGGAGATGTPPTQAPVSEGASFTVAANTFTNPGYHFVNWSDGSTTYAAGASYTMATSNVTLTAQWAANPTHSVTYKKGSGGVTGTAPTQADVSEGASFTTAANTFSNPGFYFAGWNDGSTTYAAGVSYTMGTSNVILTAQWSATPTHTVTYAGGAGATGTPPTQAPVSEGASFTTAANTFTKAGYHFVNWSDGSTTYAAGASYTMGTSDVILTAQWAANPTHTVTYAGGAGATGTPPTQAPVSEGASFTTAANTFANAGFHFVNWSDGSTTYAEGASYTMATSNVTLTAQWAANPTHTVTYAGGSGATGTAPTQAPVSEGASFTTAANTFANAGFHFVNWSDGSTTYAAGASYTMATSDVTLTAQWAANPTHTVTYAGGSGATGTPPTQADVSEGASFTTAANTFTYLPGYHFVNWSDGSTTYAAGASYTMGTSDVTLTAQWGLNPTHTVTYAGGAGATGTPPTQADVAEGASFTTAANTFSKPTYYFAGWSDGSTTYAAGVSYTMGTSDVTLTAQWSLTPTHTVTYVGGAGTTGTPPTQADVPEGDSFTTAANTFTYYPGYHFVNWTDGSTTYAEGVSYTMGTSDVTLTAQWGLNPTHTVTYAGGSGATGTAPTQADVAEGASFTTADNTFTNPGFHFVNWSDGSTTYAEGASYTIDLSDVTLTAQWAANPTHTVTYAGGSGATGTPPTQADVAEGASFTTAANTFSNPGFSFAGWNDGSTTYAAGVSYTIDLFDVTLTAQWSATPVSHTVTFNGNGSDGGATAAQTASSPTALSSNGFTRTGYTFASWNTASNGSGTTYANSATYSFGADVTLYAQWTANAPVVVVVPVVPLPPVTTTELPVTGQVPPTATEDVTVKASIEGGIATDVVVSVTVPVGAVSTGIKIVIEPASTPAEVASGVVAVKVTVTDSSGALVTHFDKPLILNMGRYAGGAVPLYSEDNLAWTPIQLISGPPLPDNMQEGYYITADGQIMILTRHLTYFALRKAQAVLRAGAELHYLLVGQSTTLNVVGGSGNGATTFQTTTPAVCSVSSDGNLVALASGICAIQAAKAGDNAYASIASDIFNLTIARRSQAVLSVVSTLSQLQLGKTMLLATSGGTVVAHAEFSTTTPDVCSVDSLGLVKGLGVGICSVVATKAGDTTYEMVESAPYNFVIVKAATLTAKTLTAVKRGKITQITIKFGSAYAHKVITLQVRKYGSTQYVTLLTHSLNNAGSLSTGRVLPAKCTIRVLINGRSQAAVRT